MDEMEKGCMVKFPSPLKYNDNLPISIRPDAIDSHSIPRYWWTPDNKDNNKHRDISFDKYRDRYQ